MAEVFTITNELDEFEETMKKMSLPENKSKFEKNLEAELTKKLAKII